MSNYTPSGYPKPEPPPPPSGVRVTTPTLVPYATYTLIGVTVLVFLLQNLSTLLFKTDYLAAFGLKYGQFIRAGQVWRLVTPLFLHASILHIGFNMYALFTFGRGMESRFGRLRFLALYFLSGFAGNVLSFVMTPEASLGASTAVFGLLAAEGVFLYQNRELLHGQARSAITSLVYMAAINLMIGFTVQGVDNWGHIGGMLGGLLFAWFGAPYWKVEGFFPNLRVVDERKGNGLLAGSLAVLIMFIPIAAAGWIWPIGK
jgi:rhomboid protease GluP